MDAPSIPPPSPSLSMHQVMEISTPIKIQALTKQRPFLLMCSRHRAECLAPVNPWHLIFEWSWWFVHGKQTWCVLGISAAPRGVQCSAGAVCGPGCNSAWETTNATAGRSFIIKFRMFFESFTQRSAKYLEFVSDFIWSFCVCRHKFWLGDAVALNSYQHLQVSSPSGTISQSNSSSL